MSIDPKYSIGIEAMDIQHARWIELIENFRATASEQLREQIGIDAAKLALEQLLNYTRSHFTSEERLMAEHEFPGLNEHKRRHQELEEEVIKLLDEIRKHKTTVTPLKLNLFLTIWLMEHIKQEDEKYARFILDKPLRNSTS